MEQMGFAKRAAWSTSVLLSFAHASSDMHANPTAAGGRGQGLRGLRQPPEQPYTLKVIASKVEAALSRSASLIRLVFQTQ